MCRWYFFFFNIIIGYRLLFTVKNAPIVLVRFVLALCSVCKRTVDLIICTVIFKLIKIGLKERRLAFLIRLLEGKKNEILKEKFS